MDEQMSIFDYGVAESEQKQDDYPCPSCDVAFGSLECFRRRGYFWNKYDRKWLRDRYGNLLRIGEDKRECKYEHQEEEEEEEEHYCMDCKYSYKRSEFDIIDKGKWAYTYVCTLTDEYVQNTHHCKNWENKEEYQ